MGLVKFYLPLVLELLEEKPKAVYLLKENFTAAIWNDEGEAAVICTIPKGFYTDLASVPRVPFAYMLFGGIGQKAAVLHDGLYSRWHEIKTLAIPDNTAVELTREDCDEIFREALKACGVGIVKRNLMYRAVRLFGGSYFKKDKPDYVVPNQ